MNLKSPFAGTAEQYTEKELLISISEDVGRLSNIERNLVQELSSETLFDVIHDMKSKSIESVSILLSIKTLLKVTTSVLAIIFILLFLLLIK